MRQNTFYNEDSEMRQNTFYNEEGEMRQNTFYNEEGEMRGNTKHLVRIIKCVKVSQFQVFFLEYSNPNSWARQTVVVYTIYCS